MAQHYGPITIAHPGCFYIDGRWTASGNPRSYPVIDPSTEEVHSGFAVGSADDARAAITAARRAFDEGPWPTTNAKERASMVSALADALEARRAELEEAWTMQTGA